MPQTAKPFLLTWPFKGINENWAFGNQPEQTCIDALNVRSYEPRDGRNRGGQRAGISKVLSTRVNSALPGQDLNSVVYTSAAATYEELDAPVVDWTADPGTATDMNAVAVDIVGNVYVAGVAVTTGNLKIWKYSKHGVLTDSVDTGVVQTPKGIAVQPGTTTPRVAVACLRVGTVSVRMFDSTLTADGTSDTAGDAYACAMAPDGKVYVTGNRASNFTAWIFPAAGGAFLTRVDFGAGRNGRGIAIAHDLQWYACFVRNNSQSARHYGNDNLFQEGWDSGGDLAAVTVDNHARPIFTGTRVGTENVWARSGEDISDNGLPGVWAADTGSNGTGVITDKNRKAYVCDDGTSTNVWKFDSDGVTEWAGGFTAGATARAGIAVSDALDVIAVGAYSAATDPVVSLTTVDEEVRQTVPRSIQHLAVSGGVLKRLDLANGLFIGVGNGEGSLIAGGRIYSAEAFQKVYYLDGRNYRVYDPLTYSLDAWIPTVGTLPDDADSTGVTENDRGGTMIELWRGRVLISGVEGDEQNIFAGAQGDPLDYDYTPGTPTVTQAWALNASNAGKIGDVVRAMIPYSDDLLIVLCDSSIWRITGDPADDGRVDLVSSVTGGARGRAWCKDPTGFIYFMGGLGGFYRIAPGGTPEDIVIEELSQRFRHINTATNIIELAWNDREKGVNVIITPMTAATTKHYFWDMRNDAWWSDRFTETTTDFDPTCIFESDGDDPDDRVVMLYGRDGYIRKFDYTTTSDDGTVFRSYVVLGPIGTGKEPREAKASNWRVVLGENSSGVNFDAFAADTVETAASQATTFPQVDRVFTFVPTAGRNAASHQRLRGASMLILLRNETAVRWQFESCTVDVFAGGRVRQR